MHIDKNELRNWSQTEKQAIFQLRMEVKITVVKMPFPCKIILQITIYHFSSLHTFLGKKWISTHKIECYGIRHELLFLSNRSILCSLWIVRKNDWSWRKYLTEPEVDGRYYISFLTVQIPGTVSLSLKEIHVKLWETSTTQDCKK